MVKRILRSAVTVLCLLLCACAQQKDNDAALRGAALEVSSTPSPVPSQTPSPQPTGTATPSPTATTEPLYISGVYWKSKLQAPVILYHRFLPLNAKESNATKMLLSDFQDQLQALYDAGYSLVPLDHWLAGDIQVPPGRRPLIFTMDDAFFADQIFLEADGTPSERSGLGLLWHFSQEHPDFGYSGALFANMGDKYYANTKTPTWFLVSDGWQDVLAKTIVWCIEHNMLPYNHTYMHSQLDIMEAPAIKDELMRNDVEIRKFLARAHREDLVPRLENYIALPFGVWPASQGLKDFMLAYRDPENKPVEAVLEAGYYFQKLYLAAPFEAGFDRFHIPRITTNTHKSIAFLSENKDLFPAAEDCKLGPVEPGKTLSQDDYATLIEAALRSGRCPEGTYRVGAYFYDARSDKVQLIWTVSSSPAVQK